MTEYRKLPKKNVWHFHPKCQHWANTQFSDGTIRSSVKSVNRKPTTGEFCNECLAKRRNNV